MKKYYGVRFREFDDNCGNDKISNRGCQVKLRNTGQELPLVCSDDASEELFRGSCDVNVAMTRGSEKKPHQRQLFLADQDRMLPSATNQW